MLLLERERGRPPPGRDDPLTAVEHHEHQDDAEDQLGGLGELHVLQIHPSGHVPERLDPGRELRQEPRLQQAEDRGAQRDTPHAAEAAEDHHHQDHDRHVQVEHVRRRGLQAGDVEGSRHAGEARADGKGEQLEAHEVHAHRARRDLIALDREPCAPDPGFPQSETDEDQERNQPEAHVIIGQRIDTEAVPEQRGRGDAVHARGTIGQPRPVAEDDRHDLAETERDDGEIVALQPQGGRAERHAESGGDDRGDRQHEPERDGEMHDADIALGNLRNQAQCRERHPEGRPWRGDLIRRENAVRIGADREEGGIAEIEQAGEADHDVEAQCQRGIGRRVGKRTEIRGIRIENREYQAKNDQQNKHDLPVADRREPAEPAGANRCRRPCHAGCV